MIIGRIAISDYSADISSDPDGDWSDPASKHSLDRNSRYIQLGETKPLLVWRASSIADLISDMYFPKFIPLESQAKSVLYFHSGCLCRLLSEVVAPGSYTYWINARVWSVFLLARLQSAYLSA